MSEDTTFYAASLTVLNRIVDNLEHILKKGEDNALQREIDPQIFVDARLAPDMHPLKKQVQIMASLVKNCPHRIAGTEPPVFEETENSFEELYALLNKTRAELASFSQDVINAGENREFSVKLGPMDVEFTGRTYLTGFTLPNVYFHVTTAYNILRHNGVPLGKMDFFGGRM